MQDSSPNTRLSQRWLLTLLLIAAALWFLTLGTRHLLEPDEGRYGEIAREMVASGDWITPRLNGLKYFEKPPLQYWATALSLKLFGINDFASRLWLGLCGFGGILLAGWTGARLFGRNAGILAAAVLGSSLMYVAIGHINTLDMSLSFWLQVTVCAFLLAQHAPQESRAERHYMWLVWMAAGMAFLTKGLIAFILPGLTLVLYTLVCRDTSPWRRLHMSTGIPLLLLVCAPWIVLASLRNPEFFRFFFWHEQFERFLVDSHDRDGPWWYFMPLLVIGALPWSWLLAKNALASWRADVQSVMQGSGFMPRPFMPRRFMWLWAIAVVAFFSLSHSKLPPYIVPIWPMLAMLLGERLATLPAEHLQRQNWLIGGALLALGAVIALLPDTVAGQHAVELVRDLRPETSAGFAITGLSLMLTAWLIGARYLDTAKAACMAALGTLFGLTLLIQGSDALEASRSSYEGAQQIKPYLTAETRLFSVRNYPQSLPFYLQRTITLVDYRGELDFGLTQQPELGIDSLADFEQAWRQPGPAIAILSPDLYTELQQTNLPMQVIARQPRWLAVYKP